MYLYERLSHLAKRRCCGDHTTRPSYILTPLTKHAARTYRSPYRPEAEKMSLWRQMREKIKEIKNIIHIVFYRVRVYGGDQCDRVVYDFIIITRCRREYTDAYVSSYCFRFLSISFPHYFSLSLSLSLFLFSSPCLVCIIDIHALDPYSVLFCSCCCSCCRCYYCQESRGRPPGDSVLTSAKGEFWWWKRKNKK